MKLLDGQLKVLANSGRLRSGPLALQNKRHRIMPTLPCIAEPFELHFCKNETGFIWVFITLLFRSKHEIVDTCQERHIACKEAI